MFENTEAIFTTAEAERTAAARRADRLAPLLADAKSAPALQVARTDMTAVCRRIRAHPTAVGAMLGSPSRLRPSLSR